MGIITRKPPKKVTYDDNPFAAKKGDADYVPPTYESKPKQEDCVTVCDEDKDIHEQFCDIEEVLEDLADSIIKLNAATFEIKDGEDVASLKAFNYTDIRSEAILALLRLTGDNVDGLAQRADSAEAELVELFRLSQVSKENIEEIDVARLRQRLRDLEMTSADFKPLAAQVFSLYVDIHKNATRIGESVERLDFIDGTLTDAKLAMDTLEAYAVMNAEKIASSIVRMDGVANDVASNVVAIANAMREISSVASGLANSVKRLDAIEFKAGEHSTAILSIDSRVSVLESDSVTLFGLVQRAQLSADANSARIDVTDIAIEDLNTTTAANTALITEVDLKADSIASDLSDLTIHVGKVETDLSGALALTQEAINGVDGNSTNITSLKTSIASAEADIAGVSVLTQELSLRADGLVSGINTLGITVTNLNTQVEASAQFTQEVSNATDKNALAISSLISKVSNAESNIYANASLVQTVQVDALNNAQAITQITSDIANAVSGAEANATLLQEVVGKADGNTSSITRISNRVSGAEGQIAAHTSLIQEASVSRDEIYFAMSGLGASIENNQRGISANASLIQTVSLDAAGNALAVSELGTRVDNTELGIAGNTDLIQKVDAKADGNVSAIASLSTSVSGLEDGLTAAELVIESHKDDIGGLRSTAGLNTISVNTLESSTYTLSEKQFFVEAELLKQQRNNLEVGESIAASKFEVTSITNDLKAYSEGLLDLFSATQTLEGLIEATAKRVTSTETTLNGTTRSLDTLRLVAENTASGLLATIGRVDQVTTDAEGTAQALAKVEGQVNDPTNNTSGLYRFIQKVETKADGSANSITELENELSNAQLGIATNAGLINEVDIKASGTSFAVSQLATRVSNSEGDISEAALRLSSAVNTLGEVSSRAFLGTSETVNGKTIVTGLTTDSATRGIRLQGDVIDFANAAGVPKLYYDTTTDSWVVNARLVVDGYSIDSKSDIEALVGENSAGFYGSLYAAINWTTSIATQRFTDLVGRPPVQHDIFTQTRTDGSSSQTKSFKNGSWAAPSLLVNGDIIATDSIAGDRISSATTIRAGSGNASASLDGADYNWRIYAGSSTPSKAPFRVDKNGNLFSESGTFGGTVSADKIIGEVASGIPLAYNGFYRSHTTTNFTQSYQIARFRAGPIKGMGGRIIPSIISTGSMGSVDWSVTGAGYDRTNRYKRVITVTLTNETNGAKYERVIHDLMFDGQSGFTDQISVTIPTLSLPANSVTSFYNVTVKLQWEYLGGTRNNSVVRLIEGTTLIMRTMQSDSIFPA